MTLNYLSLPTAGKSVKKAYTLRLYSAPGAIVDAVIEKFPCDTAWEKLNIVRSSAAFNPEVTSNTYWPILQTD